MLKVVTGDNRDWHVYDSVRNSTNPVGLNLRPSSTATDTNEPGLDFTSTGFKIRQNYFFSNGDGETIIYAASQSRHSRQRMLNRSGDTRLKQMAIDFPASPNANDTFTVGSITYKWDGTKWIGLGVTPADRLVEGSNSLEITAGNDLVWTGDNVGIGVTNPQSALGIG